ncbi:DNA alkylation repair protein [Flavobacterium sp. ZT3R18]|uniref:DNA alkylation repair protein n=1 Tax=Flavobacterium sp. ZT3R18 TaxID=2594429 RepID=UPI001179C7E7|nr:DNA alkylation repair protein [Flavobacterium sp. ZT3R18]TRX32728.1 DNA alkylation repair protein [Flavobacterium sp. ZT3R18]
MSFSDELEKSFNENSNTKNAVTMSKYMRTIFPFFGIKTAERRQILKKLWKANQQEVSLKAREIALELFQKQQREFHYCAVEILIQELNRKYIKEDIQLIEKLIITNSWWDSVDFLAKYLLGNYLLQFPEETDSAILKFSNSENMWLNRSSILFQLGYKEKTNFVVLKLVCEKHKTSTEFFIQKAIGWSLREYAKTNPEAVRNYVSNSNLKKLSEKEALKNMK